MGKQAQVLAAIGGLINLHVLYKSNGGCLTNTRSKVSVFYLSWLGVYFKGEVGSEYFKRASFIIFVCAFFTNSVVKSLEISPSLGKLNVKMHAVI